MAQVKDNKKTTMCDRIITLKISKEEYDEFETNISYARKVISEAFISTPELFPVSMGEAYKFNGHARVSKKTGMRLRKIRTGGFDYRIYPHFIVPYMRGETKDIADALFLLRWAPYWAIAQTHGKNHMYWYRCHNFFSRKSIVGTTIQKDTPVPKDLVGDEYHSKLGGEKIYLATTVSKGCFLGAEASETSDATDLTSAYGTFKDEVKVLEEDYAPNTVNLDGWPAGNLAWKTLFPCIAVISCFLHGFIKIRDRALKKMQGVFQQISEKVWDSYKAENKKCFSQRIRRLREWSQDNVPESTMKTNLLKLCDKNKQWQVFYDHPNAYRTSNMLDRLMRFMDRYLQKNQTFHGKSIKSSTNTIRAFALMYNFTPSCPDYRRKDELKSPVARLNKHEYHENWLANLLIAGSLNGKRRKQPNAL